MLLNDKYSKLVCAGFSDLQINQILKAEDEGIFILDKVNKNMSIDEIRNLRVLESKKHFSNKNILDKLFVSFPGAVSINKSDSYVDTDLFSLSLDNSDLLIDNQICFYRQMKIKGIYLEPGMYDDDTLVIDFSNLYKKTSKILLFGSIYTPDINFSDLDDVEYKLFDSDKNILVNNKLCKNEMFGKTMLLSTLIKDKNDNWQLINNNKCYYNPINEIINSYY